MLVPRPNLEGPVEKYGVALLLLLVAGIVSGIVGGFGILPIVFGLLVGLVLLLAYRLWRCARKPESVATESITLNLPPTTGRRAVHLDVVEEPPSSHTIPPSEEIIPVRLRLSTSPNPSAPGETVKAFGWLTRADNGAGIPNMPVDIETSLDQVTWTRNAAATTTAKGAFIADLVIPSEAGETVFVRASFGGGPTEAEKRKR